MFQIPSKSYCHISLLEISPPRHPFASEAFRELWGRMGKLLYIYEGEGRNEDPFKMNVPCPKFSKARS